MFDDLRPSVVLFDFYATLVDIQTDETDPRSWDVVARFLRYHGSSAAAEELKERYVAYVNAALEATGERHPDVDIVPVFRRILRENGVDASDLLALHAAQLFRSASIRRFRLFPEARQVIDALSSKFRLAMVTDSQEPYVLPELRQVGLADTFSPVVISANYGFRKPDPRIFRIALDRLGVGPADVMHVGDSWQRDVVGASDAGIHPCWICRDPAEAARRPADGRNASVLPDLRGLLELQAGRV